MLSVAYGVDWLREEGDERRPARFRRRLRAADVVRADAHLVGAVRGGAARYALRALCPGRRARRQARRRWIRSPARACAWPTNSATADSRVAGAWGKAFKLPSLYALGHPLVGNPDLAPERGESQEIELSQQLLDGKARWSATWFDGEFRNAIDFDSGPPPMLVNRNRVDTDGFELAGSLGDFRAVAARRQRHACAQPHRRDRRRTAQPARVARRAVGALVAHRAR